MAKVQKAVMRDKRMMMGVVRGRLPISASIMYVMMAVIQNQKWLNMCIMANSMTEDEALLTPTWFVSSIIRNASPPMRPTGVE